VSSAGIGTRANTRAAAHLRLVICVFLRMATSAERPFVYNVVVAETAGEGRSGDGERVPVASVSTGADTKPNIEIRTHLLQAVTPLR